MDIEGPYGRFDGRGHGRRQQVWVAGGVGITPTLPMLQAALPTGREITFIHCARSPEQQAFRSELLALAAQHPGPIDLWFCGPQGLGDALDAHAARGWRLHRESFAMR